MTAKLKEMTKSSPEASDITDQMAILRDDVRSLTATIAEMAKAKGAEVSDAAKDRAAEARDSLNSGVETAKNQAVHLQGQADDFVRNQPAVALGIAAGLGFLVGMLGSRK